MSWKGPFVVTKEISADVFEITGMEAGIPSVYHRTKLKRYRRPPFPQTRLSPAPAPLEFIDDKVEYEVEEVLDHRDVRGKRQYLLQWKGTPETSWEWETNMSGCQELLQEYLLGIGDRSRVQSLGLTSATPGDVAGDSSPFTPLIDTPPQPSPPQRHSRRPQPARKGGKKGGK